jgi:membrane associated rhomboid family serine protease
LPENHNCPGLENWNDPGGVFDSGFDDSVNEQDQRGGVRSKVGLDTGTGGILAYFRGNMTYTFLALMWITFFLQFAVRFVGINPPTRPGQYTLWSALFTLHPQHPEFVWTWFTSIFSHGGFAHIAMNSIVIYFFGRIVEQYIGSRDFALLFLGSGALAGLGQIGIQIMQGGGPGVLGASGAGLAIMGVLTVLNPSLKVYLYFLLPVPLWLLTLGYTGLTVFSIFAPGGGIGSGGVAQVAHLVGLGLGLLYGQRVKDKLRAPSQLQFGAGGPGGPGGPGGGGGRRRGPF